jgi:hypothetical protein
MKKNIIPKCIRLKNPLNIRYNKKAWKGEYRVPGKQTEFCEFIGFYYGYRAAYKLLYNTYYKKYGLKTVKQIISRWAPPSENNTCNYIKIVCNDLKVSQNQDLGLVTACGSPNIDVFTSLIKSMAKVEGCTLHTWDEIYEYLNLARYD